MSQLSRYGLLLGLFILIVDQLVKFWTYHFIPSMDVSLYQYPYGGIGVFQNWFGIDFSLNCLTNKGAAWGVLGHYQLPLTLLRIGMIVGMLIYLLFFNRNPAWQIPLVLIFTGALGNVLDFFIYGQVIDMFHFVLWGYDFPVFNVADSAITAGIAILFLLSWSESSSSYESSH